MHLSFFFLSVPLLRPQEVIGHVGFDSSVSCGYHTFIHKHGKVPFPFLPFCFRVYHSPYYILIIWALVLFFTVPFITTICWRQYFVICYCFLCVILFGWLERLDIQPRRKSSWFLDMEAGFKTSGFNFSFLSPFPLILFLFLCLLIGGVFGFFFGGFFFRFYSRELFWADALHGISLKWGMPKIQFSGWRYSTFSSLLVTISSVFLGTFRVEEEVDGWIARASQTHNNKKRKILVQMSRDWCPSHKILLLGWMELNNLAIFTYRIL